MALATTIQWEVRTTGTAGGVNGGGYNADRAGAGTDYSQQDTAHLTITDLAIDVSDGSQVSSALTPFDALDIGNVLHVTAGTGFTPGWYEVINVVGGVAVLDTACGSVGSTGGTAYLGGAILLGTALDQTFITAIVGGNTVWIKSGTYTMTMTVTGPTSGSGTAPKKFRGYASTRGDNPRDNTRPVIDFPVSYYWRTGYYYDVYNIIVTGSRSYFFQAYSYTRLIDCKFVNYSTTANYYATNISSAQIQIIGCEFVSYRGWGVYMAAGPVRFINCYFHDCVYGIYASIMPEIIGCLFDSCISGSIYYYSSVYSATILGSTFYGSENTTGIGITLAAGIINDIIYNNIFYGFTTAISHGTAGNVGTLANYNNYYNNDTDVTNVVKGNESIAADPGFADVAQITGTTAITADTGKLVDTTKNFTDLGVIANRDCVYVVSGTGVTVGIYLITAISTTTNPSDTITCYCGATALTTNATGDKVYQITTGHNFKIDDSGNACINAGYPDTTTWMGGSKI